MKISEKQIMQLITLVCEYSERLRHTPFEAAVSYSIKIDEFIGKITNQQSEELREIE